MNKIIPILLMLLSFSSAIGQKIDSVHVFGLNPDVVGTTWILQEKTLRNMTNDLDYAINKVFNKGRLINLLSQKIKPSKNSNYSLFRFSLLIIDIYYNDGKVRPLSVDGNKFFHFEDKKFKDKFLYNKIIKLFKMNPNKHTPTKSK